VALELDILPKEKLVKILDAREMTRPGISGRGEKEE
jgi:hypothetical protein